MDKQTIKIENVSSVYSGRDGFCCCGCAGKHTYREATRSEAGKKRGYDVRDEEISDRSVATIIGKMNRNLAAVDFDRSADLATLVVGKRLYVAYFVSAPKA